MISWIAIDDLVRLYVAAIENEQWRGVYNAVSPVPVSNKELIHVIARQKKFYLPFHVPPFLLKIMLGEMSSELLKSTTVSAKKTGDQGFDFLYPTVDLAIQKLEVS